MTARKVGSLVVMACFLLMNTATSKVKTTEDDAAPATTSSTSTSSTTTPTATATVESVEVDDTPSIDDLYKPKAAKPKPSGRLGFAWSALPAKTPKLESWHAIFAHENFPADRLTVGFTDLLNMPRNVAVVGKECGTVNAWYSKKEASITFCYELASFFYKAFRAKKEPKAAMQETVHALMFVELHEMGHALIGELDLGVAGGEEEAVDDFAAVTLAKSAPGIVTDGAVAMQELGTLAKKPKYFDEHPVGEQRFYNIYCVIYGSDPQKWSAFVDHPLPASRAASCPDAYRKKYKYWTQQLTPFGWRW